MNVTVREILLSLLPIIILNGAVILTWIIFAFIYPRRPRSQQVLDRAHPSFLGLFLREWVYWVLYPFLYTFKLLRLTPNMITSISLVLGLVSGWYYFQGSFALAGWLVVAGGALDIIDGNLARLTNTASKEGAFYDSCTDRYTEGAVFMGLALYFATRPDLSLFGENTFLIIITLSLLTLIGSQMVSYAKSRGESVGFTTNVGLMQRAERIALLGFFSVFYPFTQLILVPRGIDEHWPLVLVIAVMAVLTNYTAIARMIIIFRLIRSSQKGDA